MSDPETGSSQQVDSAPNKETENPQDDCFQFLCFICKEKSETPLQPQFGGLVCLSCRAFFRRAHPNGSQKPKFVCKSGGSCIITVKNRRKCQACRYKRCLKAGMKPSAVMTEDQVKVRFSKMFKRRANICKHKRSTIGLPQVSPRQLESNEPVTQYAGVPSTCQVKVPIDLSIRAQNDVSSQQQSATICYRKTLIDAYYGDQFKHMELQRTLHLACLQACIKPEIQKALTLFHQSTGSDDELEAPLKREHIFSLIVSLSDQFQHFAMQQKPFLALTERDQRLLLSRNSPRYIQLVLSFYFNQKSGAAQIESILGQTMCCFEDLGPLRLITISMMNKITNMFHKFSDSHKLDSLYNDLADFKLSYDLKPYFSNIILYTTCGSIDYMLNSCSQIHKLCKEAKDMMLSFTLAMQKETKAKSYFAIDELITTLDKCSLFFTHKFCWIENRDIGKINCLKTKTKSTDLHNRDIKETWVICKAFHKSLMTPYTNEEESWLNMKIQDLNYAFSSVSFDETFFQNVVDVYLRPGDAVVWQNTLMAIERIFLTRTWKILETFEEFRDLSSDLKCAVWTQNFNKVAAMVTAHNSFCSGGSSQIRFLCGEIEFTSFMERYGLQAEIHDLPKQDTFEMMPKAIVNSLDPSLPKMFRSLCNDVGQTIIYEKGMQLELGIWLMKLLTPPQEWHLKSELSAAEVKFMALHHKILTVLKRRIMWETHVYNEGDMEDGAAVLDAIHLKYTTFMGSLDKIDRLAVLMSNLMLTEPNAPITT